VRKFDPAANTVPTLMMKLLRNSRADGTNAKSTRNLRNGATLTGCCRVLRVLPITMLQGVAPAHASGVVHGAKRG
jgi:hypothetical protein